MLGVRAWQKRQLVRLLSLMFLVLAGCGGSGSSGSGPIHSAAATSRLLLQVQVAESERTIGTTRATALGQTRQTARELGRVRVEVVSPSTPAPVVVECALPVSTPPPCRSTVLPTSITLEIELAVPRGPGLRITVIGFETTGATLLQGAMTVDITQPTQVVALAVQLVNAAPVASAGPDQTVTVGTTVTLDGGASSDADGNALTFAWVLLVRPPTSQATLSNPTSVTPTLVVDRPGNYMAQLTVNDGAVDSPPAVVSISTRNSPPVANAGAPQAARIGVTTTLQGGQSSDVDGESLTFSWLLLSRPPGSQAVLVNPTSVTPTLVPDQRGTYVAQLTVADALARSSPATVSITTDNVPPLANAGPPQTARRGATVTLNGSGSSDVDGDPLTFAWALTMRPPGSTATLVNPTSVTPTFVVDFPGLYIAQLIVNDGVVASAPATVSITTSNSLPIADAGLPQSAPVGTVVRLDGTGSRDPDQDPLTFAWALLVRPEGSTATLLNPTSAQPTVVIDLPGTYVAQLIVRDDLAASAPATVSITTVNARPVAQAGPAQQVPVGTTVLLDGRASQDADNDPLTFAWALTVRPLGSAATLEQPTTAQPTFVIDLPGTYLAQLIVNDGRVDSAPATVSITTSNSAPIADAGPAQAVPERTLVTLDGRGSRDPDGDPLTFRWTQTAGPLVTLTNPTTAQPTFTAPEVTDDTVLTFQLVVNDGTVDSTPASGRIIVLQVNRLPVANAGPAQVVPERTLVTLDGRGSSDPDSDALTFIWTQLAGPRVTLANPSTAQPTFTAPEVTDDTVLRFQVVVNDGASDSTPATVDLTIQQVDRAPEAVTLTVDTPEDTAVQLTLTASDLDSLTTLSFQVVSGPNQGNLGPLGAVVCLPSGQGGVLCSTQVTYTPAGNYQGPDSVTFQASDGVLSSPVTTVTLTVTPVNDAPVAADDTHITREDTVLAVAAPGVLGNDADVEGDPLTVTLLDGPTHGQLTLRADGSFTYTPAPDYSGPDQFTYQASDGALTSKSATVHLTVTAFNDAPVAQNDVYSTPEDTVLSVAAPGVLGNDNDIEDGSTALTAVLVTPPTQGSLTLAANGSFTYTPPSDFTGPTSFTYQARDSAGTLSNVATVTITVQQVNDTPVAANDAFSTVEDTVLTVTAPGVLGNDTDIEGNPLTAVLVTAPLMGTLSLASDGSFVYTPNANFNGADSFTYKANDGVADSPMAMVTLTITPANDAPVGVADTFVTLEDTPLTVAAPGVLGNDTDVEGQALTATLVQGPTQGQVVLQTDGSFTYTPAPDYSGPDQFTYQASDGTLTSTTATVALTITPVNDAPVAGNDAFSTREDTFLTVAAPGVLGNDTDVEGTPLTAVLATPPQFGTLTLAPDGSFVYMPNADFTGTDHFTYQANDGVLGSAVATVTLTVTPVNDAPVAGNDTFVALEDTPLTLGAPGVLGNDTDIDGDRLTVLLLTGPTHGQVVLQADGSFTYTPALNYNGPDEFTYQVSDGVLTSPPATVSLSITAFNDTPVAQNDIYSTLEDTPLVVAAPGLLANDNDAEDGQAGLAVSLVTPPSRGTLSLTTNGAFTYTPAQDFTGPVSFSYQAHDTTGTPSNEATVTITVQAVNDTPVAVNDQFTTAEDTVLTSAAPGVLSNDRDVEGNPLTAVLVAPPLFGTLTLAADGSFVYTPRANFNGTDSFTYKANDGSGDSNVAMVTLTITPVNDAPVAVDDTVSTPEDTVLSVAAPGVLGNDSDVEDAVAALTAVLVTAPAQGTLSLAADGSFTYTPPANFNGTTRFTYQVRDSAGAVSNSATVTLTVTPANDAPVAVDESYSTAEDTVLSVAVPGVLGNDSDIDGDPLTAVLVTGPQFGTLSLASDGSFVYTPNRNVNGVDRFTYKANDGNLDSTVATVTLTVTPVNDTPVAVDDTFVTAEDTPLRVGAPGVLGNDTDVDGDALTVTLVQGPAHGTVLLQTDGSFTYTPALNYTGPDQFTYQSSDGVLPSNTATVTLTVTALNDTPVAQNDVYSTPEDTVLTVVAPGVLANDNDVEDGVTALTAILVTPPAQGTLSLAADGAFVYTPALNVNGITSFTYQARDSAGALSNLATVTLTVQAVNDAPGAVNDQFTTAEDTVLTVAAPGVLGNDRDVEGNSLTAILVVPPVFGTLTLASDGSFVYTPRAHFNGGDSFTYKTNDGSLDSNVAMVTLTVTAVNDAPVAGNETFVTLEDTVLRVAAPGVMANDTDLDGDPLTAVLVSAPPPAQGTLSLAADGSFVYTPSLNVNGTTSFTYQARDTAGALSPLATVTVTVTPVNDAPLANNETFTTVEDTVLTVTAPGVLANDSDVEGDALSAVLVAPPQFGTLSLAADGSFVYTPPVDFNGTDRFTYKANDGRLDSNIATVTVTVTPVNDAPLAVDDTLVTAEDTPLTVAPPGVLSNDRDVEGDVLTASLVAGPAHGQVVLQADGSFTYTPAANYNGPDQFTYQVSDGLLTSPAATVRLTVTPVNDAPLAVDDTLVTLEDTPLTVAAPGVLGNDSDVDGDALTAALVQGPAHGQVVLQANGSFTYTPAANYNGPDQFTYQVSDGALVSPAATVRVTVTPVNDAPVALDDAFTTAEDTPLTVATPGVLGNDSDVEGDPLSASLVQGPAHGQVVLQADGSFTYTPAVDYNGPDQFTYQVSDGALASPPATVRLSVTPVNDAPVAVDDTFTTAEDTPLTVAAPGVLANDSDVEGDPLSAILVAPPQFGTLSLAADGSFVYTPQGDFTGSDQFTYQGSDGQLSSPPVTVSLTVTPVNDAPVAVDDTFVTLEDTPLTVAAPGVLGNDRDVDGDVLTVTLVQGPTQGQLVLQADGRFTYTPALNANGPDQFTYQVSDGLLLSAIATVRITVTAFNDAPVAQNDVYSTPEDTPLTVAAPGVLGNDNDIEDGVTALTAVLVTAPAQGTLNLAADGSFTYTPPLNFTGPTSFTYQARDTAGTLSNIATVTITVPAVNDAPLARNDAFNTAEDTVLTVTAPGVLGNDTDVEGNPLTVVLVTPPVFGTVSLAPDGSFVYTPQANVNGADSFTYKANDGITDSNVAMVTLTITPVDDAPLADAGPDQPGITGTPVTFDGRNSSDIEGAPLTFTWTLTSQPPDSVATLQNPTTATPTLIPDLPGVYTAQLVVNDGSLDSLPDTVTLTAAFPPLTLTLRATPVVGVGRPATVQVTLGAPAPPGGVTVLVTTDQPELLSIAQGGLVSIAAGGTTGIAAVIGLAPGTALVRGNAPGYTEGTVNVLVTSSLITLPRGGVTVPVGQTAPVLVDLSPDRAPVGGLVVTLVSNDPARVQVLTPTVTIPAGAQTVNGTVQGLGYSSAPPTLVTASTANFASDTAPAFTAADLNILETAATIAGIFPALITVQLESSGAALAALAPGASVALTAADPGCVTITSPVTIPGGQSTTTATLTYGGITPRPCTTTVTANGPNLTADSVLVTANPLPALTVSPAGTTVGAGLQNACCRVTLGVPAPAGGVILQLSSTNATKVLVAPDITVAGAPSITLPLAAGTTRVDFVVQGVEGAMPLPSTVNVTAQIVGYVDGSNRVTVVQPVVRLQGLPTTVAAIGADIPFQALVGISVPGPVPVVSSQAVRIGGPVLTAVITNRTASVAQLTTSAGSAQSRDVLIVPGQFVSPGTVAAGGVAFAPLGVGSTTVTVNIPGFITVPAGTVTILVTP